MKVRIEVIFNTASPNQLQFATSPQCHSTAASYVITLLQQLVDLCCVLNFAAVCTTLALHCTVVLLIGNLHLIGLCDSQYHVGCWYSRLHTSNTLLSLLFRFTSQFLRPTLALSQLSPCHSLSRLPARCNGRRPSLCLFPAAGCVLSS
jgi:hypothetical protein